MVKVAVWEDAATGLREAVAEMDKSEPLASLIHSASPVAAIDKFVSTLDSPTACTSPVASTSQAEGVDAPIPLNVSWVLMYRSAAVPLSFSAEKAPGVKAIN